MIILALKTDQPEAYLGLYNDNNLLGEHRWQAHRELSDSLFTQIRSLLDSQKLNLADIEGIVCFKGPGSFTGLRIGLAAANGLGYTLNSAIVTDEGENWLKKGISKLLSGENEKLALPFYGQDAHITQPKH